MRSFREIKSVFVWDEKYPDGLGRAFSPASHVAATLLINASKTQDGFSVRLRS